MDSVVPDQDHRREALDPRRSFIVQAPAGSGKTELLIQRFLVLLSRVDKPEAVVAITFTRKAAAEMRHRVLAALEGASGPEPVTSHEKLTWSLAQAVVDRDKRLRWHLTKQPSRLRIQTIDSLCSLIVRQMPLRSQLGAELEPTESASHLYRQAAYRTLQTQGAPGESTALTDAISQLLTQTDNDFGATANMLAELLSQRQNWLQHLSATRGGELRATIEASLERLMERSLKQLSERIPAGYRREIVELARFAAANLESADIDSPLRACNALESFPSATVAEMPIWMGLAELFLTRSGAPRKRLNKNLGFPATKAGRAAKARLKGIDLSPVALKALNAVRELPPARFNDDQWHFFAAIACVLKEAVSQLKDVFIEERNVDFAEIAMGADKALASAPSNSPTSFARGVRHLLVDEFQDTSHSQYGFLTHLVRGWQPGDGRTVFLVGDPMQSIYGFREAEVELFLRAKKSGIAAVKLVPLHLSANFRSCPAIVEWVNSAFEEAFPESDDALTGAVSYAPSQSSRADSDRGNVHVHPVVDAASEVQAERVLAIIKDEERKNPNGTIAVLVRGRSHLADIVAILRSRGRRFRAREIDALRDRPVVRDLTALWQALQSTGNRIAWLSILRAPWCGLTLTDLYSLVGGQFKVAVWDRMRDDSVVATLSEDGQTRLKRVRSVLAMALDQRARLSARTWLEGAWIALGGPACLQNKVELDEAVAFLEFLDRSQVGFELEDERLFERNLANLNAPPDASAGDGLQIMTMHGAKGLEFDTVILPGLSRTPPGEGSTLLRWREYQEEGKVNLIMAPKGLSDGDNVTVHKYLGHIEKLRRQNETTRLLYVAATRAKTNLHLLGQIASGKSPPKSSLLNIVWPVVREEFARAANGSASDERTPSVVKEGNPGVPLVRLASDWTPMQSPSNAAWRGKLQLPTSESRDEDQIPFEWVSDRFRRVGEVVHRVLQQMRAPSQLDFDEAMLTSALRAEGLSANRLEDAKASALEALKKTIEDDRGRWILKKHEDEGREYEVSTVVDGKVKRMIIDRTFVENGIRWIIDYKTGRHVGGAQAFLESEKSRYQKQLERYARALRNKGENRRIKLGLYFPMMQKWIEWEFASESKSE